MIDVRRVGLRDADAVALIAELDQVLVAQYPEEGANHFRVDPDEVAPGRGAFLIAYLEGAPVACGAVRWIEGGRAEVKRMYTRPAARRRGVAEQILRSLEAVARELGARELVLETGVRQAAAIALYQRHGFAPIDRFGEYASSPLSLCMVKRLD